MTNGLRIEHQQTGEVLFDTTWKSSRVIGFSQTAANASGSAANVAFASGTPFAIMYPFSNPIPTALAASFPIASFSGSTLSWTAGSAPAIVIYGVYAATTGSLVTSGQIGFRAVNGSNVTQVDHTFSTMAFASKRAISLPLGGSLTFTVTGSYPVVAYRGTSVISVAAMTPNADGTSWTITIVCSRNLAASGTLYIYDAVASSAQLINTTTGLQIRNPTTGAVTFDSRYRYAKIVSTGAIAEAVPASPVTVSLPQDNLAAIISPGFFSVQTSRSTVSSQGGTEIIQGTDIYISGAGVNGKTLTHGGVETIYGGDEITGYVDCPGMYMLIDVTNV